MCECGCGDPAPISPVNDRTQGYVKGQPRRFLQYHHNKLSRRLSEDGLWECRECEETKPLSEFHRAQNARGHRARCKVCERARVKAYREVDPERTRLSEERSRIKVKYGLTLEEFHARKEGGCEVCGTTENPHGKGVGLVIDHDHSSGELRGVLCSFCNRAIGQLLDDSALCRRAAEYLESYQ